MWQLFHFEILSSLLLLLISITQQKTLEQQEERKQQTKCWRPEGATSKYIKEYPKKCIYGIKITNGFDYFLYYNDPEKDANIAKQLDLVGFDLCNYVEPIGSDPFQQVVIRINNNQFIDLFITCCIKCQHDSVENWRIYLKSQFLIHRYAIIQTFEKYRYEITDRMRKFNSPSICITEEYREIVVTGNNAVCFTYGEQKFINPYADQSYPSKLENLLKMGRYNATIANNYPLGDFCEMNYANLAVTTESCKFGLFRTGFKYFCCCYYLFSKNCQKTTANLVRRNNLTDNDLACASGEIIIKNNRDEQERSNMTFLINVKKMVGKFRESSENEYCYMRVTSANIIKFDAGEYLCLQAGLLDMRLRPIIRAFCSSAKDYYDFCPFKTSDATETGDIVCCCDHQHFCNYNPDIHIKLASENTTRLKCFYNDRYQYLFNQYYVRTKNNDVCLLHYIDNETLSDMGKTYAENGSIYHSYPGNGLYPIDFSYTFLKNNACIYMEVEISEASIQRSIDCFKKYFSTDHMPVKIFVCSCTLRESGNHCDQKLEAIIAERAEQFPTESLTKCVKYEATGTQQNESELIYVRHTSYCFVEVSLKMGSERRLLVRADALTRLMADQSRRYFDHIAFSMYNL